MYIFSFTNWLQPSTFHPSTLSPFSTPQHFLLSESKFGRLCGINWYLNFKTMLTSSLSSLSPSHSKKKIASTMAGQKMTDFEDLLPTMADKLGGEGLIRELCNGFRLLMDKDKEVITLESLKKNSALLGLQNLRDDELRCMLREGDQDGDGALNEMEFCVLMFRLSPDLMEESQFWLEEVLEQELRKA